MKQGDSFISVDAVSEDKQFQALNIQMKENIALAYFCTHINIYTWIPKEGFVTLLCLYHPMWLRP